MPQIISEILYLVLGAILLLGSGLGILGLVTSLRRALTPIEAIPAALLISSGITGLWLIAGRLLDLQLPVWSIILLILSAGLALIGLAVALRRRKESRAEHEPRWYRISLLLLAALALVLMVRDGGSLGPVHDSLDFVAFVNESLQTGELAPDSPIYEVGPDVPPDPRRGSFHTQIAALCHLTGIEPTDGWRWLPRLLAPLAVLGIGAMFRPWLGGRAAVLATVFFIATTFFTFDRFIQNLGYASRFGWICGWAGLLAMGQGLALRIRARWRESNALLILAAASPAILLLVHLLSGFQVLFALGCAGIAVWTYRRSDFEARRSVWWVLIGGAVLMIPAVAWRFAQPIEIANPLFDHLYGVVLIGQEWPVLHPSYLTERLGTAGLAGMILGVGFLFRVRESRAAGFLAFSSLIPLLILFFPPITRIVIAAHAHSMLFRVILTIPFAGALSWGTLRALDALARGSPGRRLLAVPLLAAIFLCLLSQSVATRTEWLVPEHRRVQHEESAALIEALEFLDGRFAEVQTVLTDPISSYSIPAYTRHDAVAPFHQHSSPLDPTVAERIRDVQEVLNGRVGMARTFRVLRRYGVDLILLNQSFPRYQTSYYVFLSPLAYPEQAAKFAGAPDLFEEIYDNRGIKIYAVLDPGPSAVLGGDPPNPDRIPDPGGAPLLTSGAVELLRFDPPQGTLTPGTPIRFDMIWRRTDRPYRLPVVCDIKLQHTEQPRGHELPVIGRIVRSWYERRTGYVVRFGHTFGPLMTFYPVFLWMPCETYRDERWENVPIHAKPGLYDVWLRLGTEPYAQVIPLQELWSNRLGGDWRRMGTIRLGAADPD